MPGVGLSQQSHSLSLSVCLSSSLPLSLFLSLCLHLSLSLSLVLCAKAFLMLGLNLPVQFCPELSRSMMICTNSWKRHVPEEPRKAHTSPSPRPQQFLRHPAGRCFFHDNICSLDNARHLSGAGGGGDLNPRNSDRSVSKSHYFQQNSKKVFNFHNAKRSTKF